MDNKEKKEEFQLIKMKSGKRYIKKGKKKYLITNKDLTDREILLSIHEIILEIIKKEKKNKEMKTKQKKPKPFKQRLDETKKISEDEKIKIEKFKKFEEEEKRKEEEIKRRKEEEIKRLKEIEELQKIQNEIKNESNKALNQMILYDKQTRKELTKQNEKTLNQLIIYDKKTRDELKKEEVKIYDKFNDLLLRQNEFNDDIRTRENNLIEYERQYRLEFNNMIHEREIMFNNKIENYFLQLNNIQNNPNVLLLEDLKKELKTISSDLVIKEKELERTKLNEFNSRKVIEGYNEEYIDITKKIEDERKLLEDTTNNYKSTLEELEKQKIIMEDLINKNDRYEKDKKILLDDIFNKQNEITDLTNKFNTKKNEFDNKLKEQEEEYKKIIDENEITKNNLLEQYNNINKELKDRYDIKTKQLEKELLTKSNEYEKDINNLEKKIGKLKTDSNNYENDKRKLLVELNKITDEKNKIENESILLSKKLTDDYNKELEIINNKLKDQEDINNKLIEEKQNELSNKIKIIEESYILELRKFNNDRVILQESNNDLLKKQEQFIKENKDIEDKYNKIENELKIINEKRIYLENKNNDLLNDLNKRKNELNKIEKENINIKAEIVGSKELKKIINNEIDQYKIIQNKLVNNITTTEDILKKNKDIIIKGKEQETLNEVEKYLLSTDSISKTEMLVKLKEIFKDKYFEGTRPTDPKSSTLKKIKNNFINTVGKDEAKYYKRLNSIKLPEIITERIEEKYDSSKIDKVIKDISLLKQEIYETDIIKKFDENIIPVQGKLDKLIKDEKKRLEEELNEKKRLEEEEKDKANLEKFRALENQQIQEEQQNAGIINILGDEKEKRGISNFQINEWMKLFKKNGWVGCYCSDELNNIGKTKNNIITFIMNTLKSTSNICGHWVAILINKKDKIVEYFDPFGNEPENEKKFNKDIIEILKNNGLNGDYQFKINRVQKQKITADTCGYHCIKFICDRLKGKSFMETTGYDIINDSLKGEKEIEKFKKHIKDFKNIKI